MIAEYSAAISGVKSAQQTFESSAYKGGAEYQLVYDANSKLIYAGNRVINAAKAITKYEILCGLHDDSEYTNAEIYQQSVANAKQIISNMQDRKSTRLNSSHT